MTDASSVTLHHPTLHPKALTLDVSTKAGAAKVRMKRREGWVDAPAGTPPAPVDDLDDKTKAELTEVAGAEGVDLTGANTKDEITAAIRAARQAPEV